MAPTKRADDSAPGDLGPEVGTSNKVWLIATVAFAGVCILGLAAGLIAQRYKQRRQYHEVAEKESPTVSEARPSRKTSSIFRSEYGDEDHQELQRQQIIDKSLASRSSSRESLGTTRPNQTEQQAPAEAPGLIRDNGESLTPLESPIGLVNDWKRWEARLRQDKARSLTHHPGLDESLHPLYKQTAPVLPMACVPARRPVSIPTGTADGPSTSSSHGQTYRLYSPLSRTG